MELRSLRYCIGVVVLAAVYFGTGYFGLTFHPVSGYATLIWPPSGIALAALVLFGYRFWPGIAAGAFLLNLSVASNLSVAAPWITAGGIAIGNTLEALLGAYLLQGGAGFKPAMERLQDVVHLIFLAAALSSVVSATIGTCSVELSGPVKAGFGPTWAAWWVGDLLSDLVFAPLAFTWVTRPFRGIRSQRLAEAAVLAGSLGVLGVAILATPPLVGSVETHLKYLVFPLLIWAALRFGPRGAATLTFAVLALGAWGATQHLGEFATKDLSTSLFFLQIFVGASAVTGLTSAAVVAERGQAEKLARESEMRLSTMAQVVPAMLFTTRPDGLCDYTNQQFYDYTGLPPGFAIGYGWTVALHPDDEERTRTQWIACVQAGQPFETEYRFRSRDGSYRWFLGRSVPLLDEQGRIVRWFGTCIDIDRQKHAEDALREADRRKDEFLAMLGHELRNPLTPIINALKMIGPRGDSRPETLVWAKEIMSRQVSHMVRLVDDLLDVSRINRGVVALRKERIDVAAIVNQAIESTRPLMQARGHELTLALAPEPIHLDADPTRLVQVMANLLNNAVKYTEPEGHIWLTVQRQRDEVVLRVKDNGIGIAADLLPRVFDLFVQSERALARSQGGLGIGLTLVRRLVEMHGGSVTAQSAGPKQGSEFIVRLPALPAQQCKQTPALPPAPCVKRLPMRVLIVDDNEDAADSLVLFLRMQGHDVHVAYDGAAALEQAQIGRPEVVLLDIGLPILNGYEVAERLRDHATVPRPVVVALTGYGQEKNRQLAKAAGFDHYLVKPVDPEAISQLLTAVANGVDKSPFRHSVEAKSQAPIRPVSASRP